MASTPTGRHPATQALLDHIRRDDIPEGDPRYPVVRSVSYTATELVGLLPDGPELSTGLRKLMEAQDCFLRQVPEADHG